MYLTKNRLSHEAVKRSVMINNSLLVKFNDKINATLQQNGHEHVHLYLKNVILCFEIQSDRIRIYLNTILQIVKWEVWKIRNFIKYEN